MNAADVIIVGAGLAGMSAACLLAQQSSLRIFIIEAKKQLPAWLQDSYGQRVSAINLTTQRIFSHLGVWESLLARRVSPFNAMEVWDSHSPSTPLYFSSQAINEAELGYIVENDAMLQALHEKIKQYPNVSCLMGVELTDIKLHDEAVEVVSLDKRVFKAALLIAADGGHSWIREQLQIPTKKTAYHQTAIVANVRTEFPHQQTARQVFLPTGPLAFLPLKDSQLCSIVWTLDKNKAAQLAALEDAPFLNELNRQFSQLGKLLQTTPRMSFNLTRQTAKHYIHDRIALIGDAAHIVHPLAGLGVNMGFLDAACLAELVLTAANKREAIGAKSMLRRYQRWRAADNFPLIVGIDAMQKIFCLPTKLMASLRGFGLGFANNRDFLKKFIINYAVGNRANLPICASQKPS